MISRETAGGILLLITVNILAVALVNASPSGYARPSYVKGGDAGGGVSGGVGGGVGGDVGGDAGGDDGGDGAGMIYEGGQPSPRNGGGGGGYNYLDAKDGSSDYGAKGAMAPQPLPPPPPPPPQPSAGYAAGGGARGQLSYGRPSYS